MNEGEARVERMLRRDPLLELIGISAPCLYAWMSKGKFPRPVRIGPKAVAWRERDVVEWQRTRAFSVGGSK